MHGRPPSIYQWVKWNICFYLQYDNLDTEHQGIFKAIFDCSGAPGDAGKLAALVDVTKKHFANEEGMMSKGGYGEFPGHKVMHDEFVAKISGLSTPLDGATVAFAKDW